MATKSERIRQLFHRLNITSSSDFVVALWQYHSLKESNVNPVDTILRWEITNQYEQWGENVNYIGNKLADLDEADYDEVDFAYTTCLDFLLNEHVLSLMYPLDDHDTLGWKIFKELSEKRVLVKKHRMISRYNQTKETQ